jgi:hypothetical protein
MSNLKFYVISSAFKLKPALKHEIGKDKSRQLMSKIKYHYSEIDKRRPNENGILGFHRVLLMIGLSLYRAMEDEFGYQDDLIETIHRILWRSRFRDITRIIAFFVRHSKNPYNLFLRLLGPRNDFFFPCPPWEKIEVELENGIGWDQKKCPYYEFFKDEGVVGLTKAYCDVDKRIAELVPNHVELKRQRTLAKGDSCCDFYYYKK